MSEAAVQLGAVGCEVIEIRGKRSQ